MEDDATWVAEVLEEYFVFDLSETAARVKKHNVETLMSVISTPLTKRATSCPTCRKRHVQIHADMYIAEELERLRRTLRAQTIAPLLFDTLAGELTDDSRLLSEEEIQIGSVDKDYKPVRSGVYFLLRYGHVVYVGQASNVKTRLQMHKADPDKDFDAYSWIPCAPEYLDTLESLYIMALRPAQNKRQPSLYAILERTKKMPKNVALPDEATLEAIKTQECTTDE
jgi:hypothetical protein